MKRIYSAQYYLQLKLRQRKREVSILCASRVDELIQNHEKFQLQTLKQVINNNCRNPLKHDLSLLVGRIPFECFIVASCYIIVNISLWSLIQLNACDSLTSTVPLQLND